MVLIGPVAVGKTTLAPLIAAELGRPWVDLDAHASRYYEEVGQPVDAFRAEIDRVGYPAAARWWQPARAHAAVRVVEDHPGHVIAFGAGHSHFEERRFFEAVRRRLVGIEVVFLLPFEDPARSLTLLRSRSEAARGHDWVRDGFDFLEDWIGSEQNRALAIRTVHVGGLFPEEAARLVAGQAGRGSADRRSYPETVAGTGPV
jgi:hypothetical protein